MIWAFVILVDKKMNKYITLIFILKIIFHFLITQTFTAPQNKLGCVGVGVTAVDWICFRLMIIFRRLSDEL